MTGKIYLISLMLRNFFIVKLIMIHNLNYILFRNFFLNHFFLLKAATIITDEFIGINPIFEKYLNFRQIKLFIIYKHYFSVIFAK